MTPPFQPKAPPQPVVRDPNNKEAPFGRDDNDKPIVPIRSDQQIAADLQEKDHLVRGDCPHGNNPEDCLLCGTKDVVLHPAVRPASDVVPESYLKVLDALDKSSKLTRGVSLPFIEHATRSQLGSTPAETSDKTRPEITSLREVLQITPQDILGLFDSTFEEKQIVNVKILGDKKQLEDDICELEQHIDEIKGDLLSRSAAWQKRNRPQDVLPKKDRERLKYEDRKKLSLSQAGLKELRQRLNNWETDERNFTTRKELQRVLQTFGEKYPITYQMEERDLEFVPDKQRKVEGIVTHTTEIMYHVDIPVGPVHDSEGYRRVIAKQGEITCGWVEWENRVILQAIKVGLVVPTPKVFRKYPHLRLRPSSETEYHDYEKTLILKTAGAQIGGSIYARGTRSGRERPLENFDTTRPSNGGEGYDADAESSAPDLTGDSDEWTPE